MAQVYNPNNGKPLDKTLGQGYDERLKSFNDTYEQLKKSRDSLATLTGDERDTEQVRFAALRSEANRQARYLGNTNQFFSRTPNRYSRFFVSGPIDYLSQLLLMGIKNYMIPVEFFQMVVQVMT